MFDKLKFWKKDTHIQQLPELHNEVDQSAKDAFSQPFSQSQNPWESQSTPSYGTPPSIGSQQFGQQGFASQNASASHNYHQDQEPKISARDVELILAKLDTIKVSLDNLSHRVQQLEQHKKPEEKLW